MVPLLAGNLVLALTRSVATASLSPPVIKPSDTFTEYVAGQGFPVEQHSVMTEDNYNLTLFRLPSSRGAGAPVVLLQHGILASCWCWVASDRARAPAFALHDLGYDVWLSNSRGNTLSRTTLDSKSMKPDVFWNFTFEDMGRFDVHANVDFVLGHTGRKDLTFLAWSQGSTQFAQAALGAVQYPGIYDASLASKVNLFAAVSPVAYLTHASSEFLVALAKFDLANALYAVYKRGFLTSWGNLDWIAHFCCKATAGALCKLTVDVFCGTSDEDDAKLIENIAAHFPAGTSVKDFIHYSQYMDKANFARYDYGEKGNARQYGPEFTSSPPLYNFSLWPRDIPVALFLGEKDALVAPQDRDRELAELNSSASRPLKFARVYSGFSHLTWFVGKESSEPWLPDLAAQMALYNPV